MLPLRHARRWQVASLMLLLGVLVAALLPAVWFTGSRVQAISWIQGIDKWVHGIAFLILSIWFAGMYQRASYWRVATGLLLFGLAIEACQRMVSYRTADWHDVAADAAGIVLGMAIALLGAGGWCLRFENRWLGNANS